MATYGKPTTSFYINYGELDPTAAQASLAPVIIAPRYALHRSDDDSALMLNGGTTNDYTYSFGGGTTLNAPYPKVGAATIVDTESVSVVVKNAYIKVTSDSIGGTVDTTKAQNHVVLPNSVTSEAGTLDTALNGYSVVVGDTIIISGGTTSDIIEATVTRIEPTESQKDTSIDVLSGTTQFTAGTASTGLTFTEDIAFLVTVTGGTIGGTQEDPTVTDNAKVVVTDISGVTGKAPQSYELDSLSGGTIGVGSGINLIFSTLPTADESAVLRGIASKPIKYNVVYFNTVIDKGASVLVDFATKRLSSEYTPIPPAYLTINESGVGVSAEAIPISLGGKNYTLYSGKVYCHYRELLTDDALTLYTNQVPGIAEFIGPIDPANPLGMMYAAASAADDAFFYIMATADASEQATIDAINYVGQFEAVYALVPYLQTTATQSAVKAVIAKYSTPEIAQYKHGWLTSIEDDVTVVYAKDTKELSLIGVLSSGELTLQGGTGVDLIANGVDVGDKVSILLGNTTDTLVTTKVTDIDSTVKVRVANTTASGVGVVKFYRELSGHEYADKLAAEASAIQSKHINFIVADVINFGGFENVSKSLLAATLAAERGAMPPHAPLNALTVPGYSITSKHKWTDVDYETMNAGGCWVVYNTAEGNVATYHQITTLTNGTIAEEDSVVSNAEAIVRRCRIAVKPLTDGRGNATNALLQAIRDAISATLNSIQAESYAATYGSRITNWDMTSLYIPEGNKRSIRCTLSLDMPQPTQDSTITFNLF